MREKKWLAILLALALVVAGLTAAVIWQGGKLRAMEQNGAAITDASAAESAHDLVSDFSVTPTEIDQGAETVAADVSVSLRDDFQNAKVSLLVTHDGATSTMPMSPTSGGDYMTELSFPLAQTREEGAVSLSLTVESNSVFQQVHLGNYPNLRSLLASFQIDLKEGGMSYTRKSLPAPAEGIMRINDSCRLSVLEDGEPIPVKKPVFWLYSNGERIKGLPAQTDQTGTYLYGPPSWDNALVCNAGDQVSLCFAFVGEDGLSYEYELESVAITKRGGEVVMQGGPSAIS